MILFDNLYAEGHSNWVTISTTAPEGHYNWVTLSTTAPEGHSNWVTLSTTAPEGHYNWVTLSTTAPEGHSNWVTLSTTAPEGHSNWVTLSTTASVFQQFNHILFNFPWITSKSQYAQHVRAHASLSGSSDFPLHPPGQGTSPIKPWSRRAATSCDGLVLWSHRTRWVCDTSIISVLHRTTSYDIVRHRTTSYDIVRHRTTSYDIVRQSYDIVRQSNDSRTMTYDFTMIAWWETKA